MSRPERHARVDPGRRRSRCRAAECRVSIPKTISIPKKKQRRLRPSRHHKKDISIPKKDVPTGMCHGLPINLHFLLDAGPKFVEELWRFLGPNLSGPVLHDTARLLLRAMGFVSQHGQLGAIPPPPFLSVSILESM